jgi:hypothetical protein
MKPSSRTARTPSKLPDSLHQQINRYALVASAAGVSLLALANPSEAKIVYTKTHQVIKANGIYALDLSHDGTVDFVIQEVTNNGSLGVKEAFGNAVEGSRLAAALKRDALIGPRQHFLSNSGSFGEGMVVVDCSYVCSTVSGPWVNVDNRYLGLTFQIKGKTHYGWARLSVKVRGSAITATLTGYAYETIPRKGIRAGETGAATDRETDSTESQIPPSAVTVAESAPVAAQPPSLGRLALGASGVLLWRQP